MASALPSEFLGVLGVPNVSAFEDSEALRVPDVLSILRS